MSSFAPLRRYIPSANPVQQATLDILAPVSGLTGLQLAFTTKEPFVNITSRYFSAYWVVGVPQDQWVLDFQAVESYVWAHARVHIMNHFIGYPGKTTAHFTTLPDSPAARQVCRSQKVVEAGNFANVNVFGKYAPLDMAHETSMRQPLLHAYN